MIFIDTNIFLRYFEQKESSECDRVEELFHAIISGEVTCFTNTMVISEIIWVLDKYYGWDRQEICDNIELILNTPNIKIKERNILHHAISIYRQYGFDFIDSYNYSYIKANNSSEIYSYDKHFDKLASLLGDIEKITP
jgi:predicted nucleic-acid-binding protein